MTSSNTSLSSFFGSFQPTRATSAYACNRFIHYAATGSLTVATSFAIAAAPPFAGQPNLAHNQDATTPFQIRVFTGKNSDRSEMLQVTDMDGNGAIDSGDISLLLLNMSGEATDAPNTTAIDIADTTNQTSSLTGFVAGIQGLYARNYLLAADGSAATGVGTANCNAFYSVMDVYVKYNSAVGTGSAGERIVSFFGNATTDSSTYGVIKSTKFVNSVNLTFQHSNGSWLPGASANGGAGNNTWDSFVGIGGRTQGVGNTGAITADTYWTNPNTSAAMVGGSSGPTYVGPGWYQSAPTEANNNNRLDTCEIAENPALDRNTNGIFDTYDCAQNPALDCNHNLQLDQYEIVDNELLDCDYNGKIDSCEITNGVADDDRDGHLDICEFAKGDLDLNGVLDSGDISIILLYMGDYDPLFGDLDGNGVIGTGDLSLILLNFGPVTWP